MSEIRMLVVGDVHLSDQNPSARAEGYTEEILDKCAEVAEIAKNQDATHVLFLGDLFDNKTASRVSHRLVQSISMILLGMDLPVYILVGNHDLAAGGTLESLPKQPLGTVGLLPNVTLLTWDELALTDDISLFPIPGVPLEREGDAWLRHFQTGSDKTRRIIVAHQLIVPDVSHYPEAAQRSFYAATDIALHTDAHLVLSGDVHSPAGFYALENGRGGHVGFSNFGSLCRRTAKETAHKPAVMLLTIADDERRTLSHKKIPLTRVKPAEEVYRLEEHYEAKEHQADIDETIRRLKTTTIAHFSIESVIEEIKNNQTADEPVRDTAVELIEHVT